MLSQCARWPLLRQTVTVMKKFREAQELAAKIDRKYDCLEESFFKAFDSYEVDIADLERRNVTLN
jgi:hypothetical protein